MPGFDGTGPGGRGPMTGGRRGRCNPRDVDAFANDEQQQAAPVLTAWPWGRGRGQGMQGRGPAGRRGGGRRGWGNGFGRNRAT